MGYSPWGRKESDTTERLHFISYTFGGGSSFFHETYFDIYAYYCVHQ